MYKFVLSFFKGNMLKVNYFMVMHIRLHGGEVNVKCLLRLYVKFSRNCRFFLLMMYQTCLVFITCILLMKKLFSVSTYQRIVEDDQMVCKLSVHILKAYSCFVFDVDIELQLNIVTDGFTLVKMSHFYKLKDN